MGYDIHITRSEDWAANADSEISQKEWLAVVEGDTELTLDPRFGECSVLWKGEASPADAWFDWYKGNVFTTNPDRAILAKAIEIASRLRAEVHGDDGKRYHEAGELVNVPEWA